MCHLFAASWVVDRLVMCLFVCMSVCQFFVVYVCCITLEEWHKAKTLQCNLTLFTCSVTFSVIFLCVFVYLFVCLFVCLLVCLLVC